MVMVQSPALDPTVQVPQSNLPLGILKSLEAEFGDIMQRAFEHVEERRFAAQNTCLITRPLTPEDLADVETIKPEPAPVHDRRIVNDRGEPVSLEKGYFSGHPEEIAFEAGVHRAKPRWQRTKRCGNCLLRLLKKMGLVA